MQSLPSPGEVQAPRHLFRVARIGSVTTFAEISPQESTLADAGNRFDVLGAGALYAATDAQACFAATLSRYRVSAEIRERVVAYDNGSHMICGGVPADWRARRVKATFTLENPLPFLDVDDPATHEFLTNAMGKQLAAIGVDQLDEQAVRGPNRRITRAIASWAFNAVDGEGEPLYSGLRYMSRLGPWECWAIFEGTIVETEHFELLQTSDPDIIAIAELFGLRLF